MLPFYCVLSIRERPALLKAYRSAVDQWWKNIQREANPLWTFIYLTGQPKPRWTSPPRVDALPAAMDTIEWTVRIRNARTLSGPRRWTAFPS